MAARTLATRISPLVSTAARSPSLLRSRALVAAVGNLVLHRSLVASATSGGLLRRFSTSIPSAVSTDLPTSPGKVAPMDGCDYEHYFVVMDAPDSSLTRDQIIDSYVKTLADVLGSEKEARMAIYSVSTKYYYAFGCNVPESLTYKIKKLPKVRWVMPDSYLDAEKKDYGGEPFINGQAVPYDPKYHAHWVKDLPSKDAQENAEQPKNSEGESESESKNLEGESESESKNLEGESESEDEETNKSDDDIETDTTETEDTDSSEEDEATKTDSSEEDEATKTDSSEEVEATETDSSEEDEEIEDMNIIEQTKNLELETENTESSNVELQKDSLDDVAADLSRNLGEKNTDDFVVDLSKNLGDITIDLCRDVEAQDGMTVQITIPPKSPRKVTILI